MRLHFKEEPKEWRKATLLSLIGPSVLTGILRCKAVISWTLFGIVLACVALVAVCVLLRPQWFRGYYRGMTWFGFHVVQIFGRVVLTLIFFVVVTPLGWMLRLAGKDLLQLKSPRSRDTYWQSARQDGSLDSMF